MSITMTKPIIYKVDEDTYHSGRLTDDLRLFKTRSQRLRFFDARCNWTQNKRDEQYYHILAEDESQAESLAVQEYANEFHIGQIFVQVHVSRL